MPSYPYPKLELKYCERCGGIWLRPRGVDNVYCASCAEEIRQLPPARGGNPSGTLQAAYGAVVSFFAAFLPFADCMGGVLCQ